MTGIEHPWRGPSTTVALDVVTAATARRTQDLGVALITADLRTHGGPDDSPPAGRRTRTTLAIVAFAGSRTEDRQRVADEIRIDQHVP